MAKTLRALALVMGVACALIGICHFVLGQWSVPGAGPSTPIFDSRERFYSAIFAGFGLAWIWVARQTPVPAEAVRLLSGIFLLGGIGRVISLIDVGRPHWMQLAEGAVELVLPFVFFWLAPADEKAARPESALRVGVGK